MSGGIPAINGPKLAKLLEGDGWQRHGGNPHGWTYKKTLANGETLVTTVPNETSPMAKGTLNAILGPRQTRLGRSGFLKLLRNR
jgi:predicted RNA binding protein YcfA (HicA-like mRNA interferase family)